MPCGDASMAALDASQSDIEKAQNEIKRQTHLEKYGAQQETNGFIRGRNDYSLLNGNSYINNTVLRTKPGRIDAQTTLSMSCSGKMKQFLLKDKLASWNVLGCHSALLDLLLPPVYFETITISNGDVASLQRSLVRITVLFYFLI